VHANDVLKENELAAGTVEAFHRRGFKVGKVLAMSNALDAAPDDGATLSWKKMEAPNGPFGPPRRKRTGARHNGESAIAFRELASLMPA
jgi:hypothetical protein